VAHDRSERVFCTLREAAVFLGLPYNALRKRHQRGTMIGVAKAIDGSPWRASSRSQVLVEASVLREHLDEQTRKWFDDWCCGRLTLAGVKRRMLRDGDA
jgi:hypothetical protein